MKFKKLLISASAIAAGSGLLATVLTSCAKANIDAKLRVELDDAGKLYNPGNMEGTDYTFTWKEAIKAALNKSSNWAQFKNALADEIVYSWYVDRASTSKSTDDKNATFRSNLDEWNYNIDNDYKNVIQNCKNKYGANWEFYLQNEYLAPNGGTEAAYKKNKLVEKVKTDFISKVFAKNYFGMRKQTPNAILPFTYTPATKDVDSNTLRNPSNWDRIGFFARADLSFPITTEPKTVAEVDYKQLAKHPDGDYAAIQDYVFDRWFNTEKPFYSAAALFKYSMPKYSATKLDEIYNAKRTGVKLPDKPNEAFPFFGSGTDGSTRKAVDFLNHLDQYKYASSYNDGSQEHLTNGTVTIDLKDTDDTQTLLLVTGSTMFGALYIPYAMAAGSLYDQMMGGTARTGNNNILIKAQVRKNIVDGYEKGVLDDFAILSNFFYTPARKTEFTTITKVLDLNSVYGGIVAGAQTEQYHCPLFLENKEYNHFYGDTTKSTSTANATSGIRYITNNVQVNDFQFSSASTDIQPWVMELNESGMHIQTIDGYNYIKGASTDSKKDRLARQKKVIMYRLLQKQTGDEGSKCISSDAILGENGKIKTYFTENFANIILELALLNGSPTDTTHQVFRSIASYAKESKDIVAKEDYFLNKIFTTEKLGSESQYTQLQSYLNAVLTYEDTKKTLTSLENANSKILAYRSKQISNTKSKELFSKTLFENGLLAPFVYAPENTVFSTRDYKSINRITTLDIKNDTYLTQAYYTTMNALANDAAFGATGYVANVITALQTDADSGFSPQIKTAKTKMSNRFWFGSRIIDKAVHTVMGSKAFTANQIKMNAYKYYTSRLDGGDHIWLGEDGKSGRIFGDRTKSASNQAFLTTYARSKVLTGDKNVSTYSTTAPASIADYYTMMDTQFNNYLNRSKLDNGDTCDDALNYQLLKATIMYLLSVKNDVLTFDNFYTLLNSKISEDELAFTGYMARGYSESGMGKTLDESKDLQKVEAGTTLNYGFDASVDNEFDKFGYAGGTTGSSDGSKISSANYWTAINKTFSTGVTKAMNGFLGLQTKSNNQLDSGSGLQSAVFDKFALATKGSYNLSTGTQNTQNTGCWFKFGGTRNNNDEELTWLDFTYDDEEGEYKTCKASEWFPLNSEYAPVRKIAKKIIERDHEDDLRALAQQLASTYNGFSYFSDIGNGTMAFPGGIKQMKMKMLKLLPSKMAELHRAEAKSGFDQAHYPNTFSRLVNIEAHTDTVVPSTVFTDSSAKTSYKLLLTQINKADIVERTLAPEWDDTNKVWKQGTNSPITPEEFWVLFFNLASESTVQQRVVTEVVKAAFGEKKLIVYDAQLYNQFDSIWIKDWTKKTIGA